MADQSRFGSSSGLFTVSFLLAAFGLALDLGLIAVAGANLALFARFRSAGRFFLGTAAAATLLIGYLFVASFWPVDGETGRKSVAASYSDLWRDLDRVTALALETFADPEALSRDQCFLALAEMRREYKVSEEITLLLLDRNSEAFAWDGPGLLHEPVLHQLPRNGSTFVRGFTAVTLLETTSIESTELSYRILAGRSFGTNQWSGQPIEWSVVDQKSREIPAGWIRIDLERRPSLIIENVSVATWRHWVTVLVTTMTLILIAAAALFAFNRFSNDTPAAKSSWISVAVAAITRILEVDPSAACALTIGSFAAGLGFSLRAVENSSEPKSSISHFVRGSCAGSVLVLATLAFHRFAPNAPDLGFEIFGSLDSMAWRLAWALGSLGLFLLSTFGASLESRPGLDDRLALGSFTSVLLAGALIDTTALSLGLAVVASGFLTAFVSSTRRGPVALAGSVMLVSLVAAAVWESSYRLDLRHRLHSEYLPLVTAPIDDELNNLSRELFEFFEQRDISATFPSSSVGWGPGTPDLRDLAFALWRESPMPRRDALSALVIESYSGIESSSFAFGLGLDRDLQLAFQPTHWSVPQVAPFRDALISGQAEIFLNGSAWGEVRYWFIPRPGFRLDVAEIDELDRALVRGEAHRKAIDGLPKNALWAVYDASGESILSPWYESPGLTSFAKDSATGVVETPTGRAFSWRLDRSDHSVVLYLPVLGITEGLERIGAHACGVFSILVLASGILLLIMLPSSTIGELCAGVINSYSNRLIVASTILLLVPLAALTLILLEGFEDRLRSQQLEQGTTAVDSARLLLVDYLLGLEPGFVIETQLDRELMAQISRVVRHQVNLYWSGREIASSRQEMFTAGLLPRRIPGGAFSRLALRGNDVESRIRESGDLNFLEIYAPLLLPGVPAGHGSLFVSVPLIEQEEEVASELQQTRRRALLVASALFILLVVVSNRLAQRFTKPILGLISDTQRIAAGSGSLRSRPRERELIALADAIDVMAHRVAEGRRRLIAEKQLVERMVEQITSGVVSLDRHGRVLMQNLVASRSLQCRIGDTLTERLALESRLDSVLQFVQRSGRSKANTTVRVAAGEDDPPGVRQWSLVWLPLPGDAEPSTLLIFDDATEVLRAQRLEAWAEMARIIAHEIKNPLTPIRLSAEHLQRVYATSSEDFGQVLKRCTTNILEQVEELRDIATDFTLYSRIPEAQLQQTDLVAVMESLVESYNSGGSHVVQLVSNQPMMSARIDQTLLTRAVRNLIENSVRASQETVIVELRKLSSRLILRVEDAGPGVATDHLEKIFDPYFSTYDTGTGLGLAIARRIVEEHSGTMGAENLHPVGFRVTIELPISTE